VVEHVVPEAIGGDWVVYIVALEGVPVVGQFFGAEDEHGAVAVLVVLDDGQGGEGLAESDAVREYATVVGFQLVDYREGERQQAE